MFKRIIRDHKSLLSGDVVEWARIEFKVTWDPAAPLKTICVFANPYSSPKTIVL